MALQKTKYKLSGSTGYSNIFWDISVLRLPFFPEKYDIYVSAKTW